MVFSSAQRQVAIQSESRPTAEASYGHCGSAIVIPRNGLEFPRRLPFEKWVAIGRQLSAIGTSSAWCLGDWLTYGIASYSGRYRDAIEQTSLDYQTLRNYAWVASRFPLSRRRDTLSFGHHAEVAALPAPEQDFWLRKADEEGWPVKRLRREVRDSLKERQDAPESQAAGAAGTRPPMVSLHIQVPRDHLESCRVAARRAGLSTQEWVVMTLQRAARQTWDAPNRPPQSA